MRVATWNVNSLNARMEPVTQWLRDFAPDVLCMQEIKMVDQAFPHLEFSALGYNAAVHGQKSYNGVAILSKRPMEDVTPRLPGDEADDHARYIEAVIMGNKRVARIASIYLPNGNPAPGEKYDYKLGWMDRLTTHARKLLAFEEPLILAGDYNVIPSEHDVYDASAWTKDALFLPTTRAHFRTLLNLGFTDAIRACHAEPGLYTFWDYQAGAWQKNHGIRIDHMLLSPQAADLLKSSGIDSRPRSWEKPSDHVPVWCDIDF
jgi:exodeoxyribonuclease-3